MADEKQLADKRRMALRHAMAERHLTPTELARRAGLSNANALFNFLNGISKSLSTTTYQKIVAQLPGVTIHELLGERPRRGEISNQVLLKTHCQGSYLRDHFSLQPSAMRELPLPLDDEARQAGAFAALVKRPGAEEIYPASTILLCVPTARFSGKIEKGRRLIVERFVGQRIEVTVREVQTDAEGRLWLSQRSTDPRLQGSVKMASENIHKVWQSNNERYAVAGVVIGSFHPE